MLAFVFQTALWLAVPLVALSLALPVLSRVILPHLPELTYYAGSSGNYEIYLMDITRGLAVNLTRSPGEDSRPAWSPDGEHMAFYSHRDGRTDLYLLDVASGELRRLALTGAPSAYPAWSPDGQWITYTSILPRQVGIYRIRPDGTDIQQLAAHRAALLRWSPDGRRLLFMSDCDNNCDLYVMDADGSNLRQLTRNGIIDAYPIWSPDSRRIVFMSTRDIFYELYMIEVDCDESGHSGCEAKRLTENRDFDGFPDWSPDGREIAFSTDRDGNFEIYSLDTICLDQPVPCDARRLTDRAVNDRDPVWSPDGRWIAFISVFDVYLMNAQGGDVRLLSRSVLRDQYLVWRP